MVSSSLCPHCSSSASEFWNLSAAHHRSHFLLHPATQHPLEQTRQRYTQQLLNQPFFSLFICYCAPMTPLLLLPPSCWHTHTNFNFSVPSSWGSDFPSLRSLSPSTPPSSPSFFLLPASFSTLLLFPSSVSGPAVWQRCRALMEAARLSAHIYSPKYTHAYT